MTKIVVSALFSKPPSRLRRNSSPSAFDFKDSLSHTLEEDIYYYSLTINTMIDAACLENWELYKAEFDSLIAQHKKGESTDNDNNHGQLVEQCQELWQSMSLEARSVSDPKLKAQLLEQVQDYKNVLHSLQSNVERQDLLGDRRRRSAQGVDTSSTTTLDRSLATMHETESTAVEIVNELAQNREKLAATHKRIHETQSLAEHGQAILKRMSRWGGW